MAVFCALLAGFVALILLLLVGGVAEELRVLRVRVTKLERKLNLFLPSGGTMLDYLVEEEQEDE